MAAEKVALMMGVTGQDGAYLADTVLTKAHLPRRRATILRRAREALGRNDR